MKTSQMFVVIEELEKKFPIWTQQIKSIADNTDSYNELTYATAVRDQFKSMNEELMKTLGSMIAWKNAYKLDKAIRIQQSNSSVKKIGLPRAA
jgi:hypothetical protein